MLGPERITVPEPFLRMPKLPPPSLIMPESVKVPELLSELDAFKRIFPLNELVPELRMLLDPPFSVMSSLPMVTPLSVSVLPFATTVPLVVLPSALLCAAMSEPAFIVVMPS